jgi:hypothetical protein
MPLSVKLVEITSLILTCIALFISIVRRENKYLFPIQLYIIICIIVPIVDLSYSLFANILSLSSLFALHNIQTLLEISLIYYFLHSRLRSQSFRNSIKIFIVVYIAFCLTFWIKKENSFFAFAPDLIGLEGLLISVPCLFYIYEILSNDMNTDLRSNSNFIVACGLLFYFSISIPIFFCWYVLYYLSPGSDKILTITNQIFFTILIVSFMKAYLCPVPDQQQ